MPYFTVRGPVTLASFLPSDISNLIGWWKADAGTFSDAGVTPSVNGGGVRQWNDNSGVGNNLTGSNDPILRTNTLNGRSTLEYVDPTALLKTGFALGGTVLSIFMVVKVTVAGVNFQRLMEYNGVADFAIVQNNSLTDFQVQTGGGTVGFLVPVASAWNQLGTVFNGTNNTPYVAGAAGSPVATTPTFGASGILGVGCTVGGGDSITGFLAEVLIYKAALTAPQIANITSYFTTRWGV